MLFFDVVDVVMVVDDVMFGVLIYAVLGCAVMVDAV